MKKRTISLILSVLLVFSIVSPCFAVTDAEDRASRPLTLSIDGGVATAKLNFSGGDDVYKISATVYFERDTNGFWTRVYIKLVNNQIVITENDSSLSRTMKVTVPNAGTYRVVAEITCYGDTTKTYTKTASAYYDGT